MEIRVLFVHTNYFLQALCSHALNYNLRHLLSLWDLTAIWAQKSPTAPPNLCPLLVFHSYSTHPNHLTSFSAVTNVIGSPWLWHELYHHVSSENEIIFWNEADQVRTYFHFLDFQFHLNVGFGALKKPSSLSSWIQMKCAGFFSWDKQCPSHGWKNKKQKQEFQNCAFRLRSWSPPAEVFAIDF